MDDDLATRGSGEALPMPRRRKRLPLDLRFEAGEWAKIARGLVPHNLDDKWFVFLEGDWLNVHRANGPCIYRLRFMADGNAYRSVEFWVNRDPAQHRSRDDDDCMLARWILEGLLLDKDVPFPPLHDVPGPSVWEQWTNWLHKTWQSQASKPTKEKTTSGWLRLVAKKWDVYRTEHGAVLYMELGTETSSAPRSHAQMVLDGYLQPPMPDWIVFRVADFKSETGQELMGLIASAIARRQAQRVRVTVDDNSAAPVRELLRSTRMDRLVPALYGSIEEALAAPDAAQVQ